jgi:hypothetical protein
MRVGGKVASGPKLDVWLGMPHGFVGSVGEQPRRSRQQSDAP